MTAKLRRYGPVALATLASGAVMMTGGYLFHRDGWGIAGSVMIPAGPLISIAFALERRASGRLAVTATTARVRGALMLFAGLPSPGGNLAFGTSVAVQAVTLAAGAVVAVGGYAVATWNPLVVPLLVVAGGMLMTAAFVIAARADHPRSSNPVQAP